MMLKYPDGSPLVEVYTDPTTGYDEPSIQGATIAFNVLRNDGSYVSWMEVEKMANAAGVFIRAGGQLIQH
jgi:molybdenum cofactor sulfurtransferase